MKTIAIIERGNDGTFSAYLEDTNFEFGLLGDGKTVEETKQDFLISRDEMKAYFEKEGKEFPELEFEFKFDTASFLSYYSTFFTLAGLGKITGINPGQLSHYLSGHRTPRPVTIEKIEKSLHAFANEISHLHFI